MASDKPVQDAFLAAIEAKIAAWTAVGDAYRNAVALDGPLSEATAAGAFLPSGSMAYPGRVQHDLPVGVFRDKSLKEAIPIYLGVGRRKQTNKEIATGLITGGFPTTSENFDTTVATALYRLKHDGVVLRFSDGWDLASSYPEGLRTRLEKDAAPRKKLRARVRRVRRQSAKTEAPRTKTMKVLKIKPKSNPRPQTEDNREAV